VVHKTGSVQDERVKVKQCAVGSETAAPAIRRMHFEGRMVNGIGGDATVSDCHELGPANQVTGRWRWPRVVAFESPPASKWYFNRSFL
jgi:hypothetical protein